MSDIQNIFNNITIDIQNLNIKGISDLTPLQSKQLSINPDLLKFTFDSLTHKYDFQSLEFFFNNYYNFVYDQSYDNILLHKHNNMRNKLINLYTRCIITGKSHILCDAAHILSYYELLDITNNPIDYRYETNNGFLLCKELCVLFTHPKRYLKINPYLLTIEFNNDILNDPDCKDYHKYHNQKLNINISETTIKYLIKIY